MRHKKLLLCGGILIALLSMSGCVDDIADGLDKAGSFLKENKEPIESGIGQLQDALVDASDKLNDYLHDQQTITTTTAPEPPSNVEIITVKGMKY